MEKLQNNPEKEDSLKLKIENAIKSAFPINSYEEQRKKLKELQNKQINEGLSTSEDFLCRILKDQFKSCAVIVQNISEYRKVLELAGLSGKAVDQILSHENAHANVAEQLPSQIFKGYSLRFLKEDDGRIIMHPQALFLRDNSFSEEQLIEDEIKVTEAPIYYGDELSPGDKKSIENLKNKLSINK